MKLSRARIGWIAAAVAALLLVLWWARPRPIAVETAVVAEGPLQVTLEEEGTTRVLHHVEVAAPVSGRLAESALRVGDAVAAGAAVGVLRPAPLDPRARAEAQAALASAQSLHRAAQALVAQAALARDQAQRSRVRAENLAATGSLSQQDLESAVTEDRMRGDELVAARAREAAAAQDERRARLALVASDPDAQGPAITLRTPIGGRVLHLFEEHDRVVPAGTSLVEVGDPRTLEIYSDVLSRDATAIVPGMPMIVMVPGRAPVRARVDRVEPSAFTKVSPLGVEEQRVYVVGAALPETLGLGDRFEVDVSIVLWEAGRVLQAPATALVPADSGWAAFVVDGGRARLRPVGVGRRGARAAQVVAGLKAGDRVIVHPDERLKDGVRVRPAD